MSATKPVRLEQSDDRPIVPPPSDVTVIYEAKPVLYLPNGKVLVRRMGF